MGEANFLVEYLESTHFLNVNFRSRPEPSLTKNMSGHMLCGIAWRACCLLQIITNKQEAL